MSGVSQTSLVGRTLAGRYRLTDLLGQGGMGTVYKAVDGQMSDRVVAVKVLAPHLVSDEKQVMRFEQEARAANQLRHPNTISVLDFGRDSAGHIFMVIEFLVGETLTGALSGGRMDVARCLYIFRQICKSLAEAHSKSIVHRDLKPDNIFVCEIYGEADFVKVIDFGIAKFLEDENAQLTQAGKMFGTPRYLSPEQAQGKRLDNRSDLYSLGVIMFECITGRPPFIADEPIAVAIMHVQEQAPHLEDVAPDIVIPQIVDRLVFKLLAKRPGDRYQSAEEVVVAIDEAMIALQRSGGGLPVGHYTPHAAMTPARPHTIPPASQEVDATRAMMPISSPEDDATRAMDAIAPDAATRFIGAMTDEVDATRAMDSVVLAPTPSSRTSSRSSSRPSSRPSSRSVAKAAPHPGGEATVALDTVDALKVLERGTPPAVAPEEAPKAGVGRWVLLLVVALVVIGGGIFWALRANRSEKANAVARARAEAKIEAAAASAKRQKRQKRAQKAAEHRADEERKRRRELEERLRLQKVRAAVHTVTLESTPPGAKVVLRGMEVGVTPYAMKLHVKDAEYTVLLKLDGYENHEVTIKAKTLVDAHITRLPSTLTKTAKPKPLAAKAPTAPHKKKAKKKLDWGM